MISGREAIKKSWANLIESANASSAVLTSLDVMPSDDSVVELGEAKLSIASQGPSPAEIEVKYVVYSRHEDRRWKWHVDIWNQNSRRNRFLRSVSNHHED